jgi:PST family polysaccharide transporter
MTDVDTPQDSASGRRRLALVNTLLLGSSQAIRLGVRALYILVLAHFLGIEDFGLFNYGLSWYLAFLSLTYMGFDLAIGREAWADSKRAKDVLASTMRIQLLAVVIASGLCWGTALLIETADVVRILGILTIGLIGRSFAAWISFVLVARGSSNQLLYLDASCRLGEAGLGSAALILGAGLDCVLAIHALSWWVQMLIGMRLVRVLSIWRLGSGLKDAFKIMGLVPLIFGLAGLFQVWVAHAPLLLFRQLGGDAVALGKLALSTQVFGLLAGVSWVAMRALLPEISRSIHSKRSADATVVKLVGPVVLLSVGAITAVVIVIGGPLIRILLGSDFAGVEDYLPLAVISAGGYTIAVGLHQILSAHHQNMAILIGTGIAATVTTFVMTATWKSAPEAAPYLGLLAGTVSWAVYIAFSTRRVTPFSLIRTFAMPALFAGLAILAALVLADHSLVAAGAVAFLLLAIGAGAQGYSRALLPALRR